jgi:hypothetical protein
LTLEYLEQVAQRSSVVMKGGEELKGNSMAEVDDVGGQREELI